jgi:hypothetical protein
VNSGHSRRYVCPSYCHNLSKISGGGFTLCGKYLRDNADKRSTVDLDFGRSDALEAGVEDLADVGAFSRHSWQASRVCISKLSALSTLFPQGLCRPVLLHYLFLNLFSITSSNRIAGL